MGHMLWLEPRPELRPLVRIPTVTEEMKAQGASDLNWGKQKFQLDCVKTDD